MSPVSASASVPALNRAPMMEQGSLPPMEASSAVIPPVIEMPDQAAGTAGVYRSRNVAEEPTPHFETRETDTAVERVKATARPLGSLAVAGVATVVESSYAEEYRHQRGTFVLRQQAEQQSLAALRALQEQEQKYMPSLVDTKKNKRAKASKSKRISPALGDDDPFKYLRRRPNTPVIPRIENGRSLN